MGLDALEAMPDMDYLREEPEPDAVMGVGPGRILRFVDQEGNSFGHGIQAARLAQVCGWNRRHVDVRLGEHVESGRLLPTDDPDTFVVVGMVDVDRDQLIREIGWTLSAIRARGWVGVIR